MLMSQEHAPPYLLDIRSRYKHSNGVDPIPITHPLMSDEPSEMVWRSAQNIVRHIAN